MGDDYRERILTNDEGFNQEEYEQILKSKKGMVALAISSYRYTLLNRRNESNLDFSENKNNVEKLFLESFEEKQFERLMKRLIANGWTLKEAYRKVVATGERLIGVSAIPCLK